MLLCGTLWGSDHRKPETPPPALRAAVPLMCTENNLAFRTFVRGTGVIADSGGTLLTAAHVIQQARSSCTLSVMIPDDEWIHTGRLRRFLVTRCHLNEMLDIAVCRVQPADDPRDLAYVRAAPLRFRSVTAREPVWVTGFAGWLPTPLTQLGHITGQQDYRLHGGCRCDFATDIAAVEGMSGSPVISSSGEVLGILTQAGKGRFRGISFGISFEEAKSFLTAEGILPSSFPQVSMPQPTMTTRSFARLFANGDYPHNSRSVNGDVVKPCGEPSRMLLGNDAPTRVSALHIRGAVEAEWLASTVVVEQLSNSRFLLAALWGWART
jgi:hypothetical protein